MTDVRHGGSLVRNFVKNSFGEETIKGVSKQWLFQVFKDLFPSSEIRITNKFFKFYETFTTNCNNKFLCGFVSGWEDYQVKIVLQSDLSEKFGDESKNVIVRPEDFFIASEISGYDGDEGYYYFYGWEVEVVK